MFRRSGSGPRGILTGGWPGCEKPQPMPVVGEFFDVVSGPSDQRRGLRRAPKAGGVGLPVGHEERLAWFGTGVIRDVMLPPFSPGLEIAGTDEVLDVSRESELTWDILAVVTSFSSLLYGSGQRSQDVDEGGQVHCPPPRLMGHVWPQLMD
ncbi:hypothetical protein AB0H73_17015 [Streptomyces olivoreticuli]|uniref:hypothetical protein n=1 Tax=Streptomyces olivoreticuli TaxID=68246 RepID=UPI0013C35103|nr:hypothetical protein [Streptomyces olivoreticuli]